MFGLFKKAKVANSIKTAVKDILNDKISAKECQEICSNEISASWLCTELMVQKFNSIAFVVDKKYSATNKWANWQFLVKNLIQGVKDNSSDENLPGVLLNGLTRLISIEGAGRSRIATLYKSSAELVLQHDTQLTEQEVTDYLGLKIEDYIMSMGKYFN